MAVPTNYSYGLNAAKLYTVTASENIPAGRICYINELGEAALATNTDVSISAKPLCIALESIAEDFTGQVLLYGVYKTTGLTTGSIYYLDVDGRMTTTLPASNVRVLGQALSSTELLFK